MVRASLVLVITALATRKVTGRFVIFFYLKWIFFAADETAIQPLNRQLKHGAQTSRTVTFGNGIGQHAKQPKTS
jgi:hypothetical protein